MKSDLQFAFRVSEPSIEYGFRKLSKAASDLIDDVWEATCKAVCLAPDKFAGREAAVRIYANDALRADRRSAGQVVNLGQVFANAKDVEAVLYLPQAECWGVVAAITAGSVQYLTTFSEPLFRSTAEIDAFAFEGPQSELARDDQLGRSAKPSVR